MSKKIMALVLTLSMLLCFAACGSETDSVETATSQSNSNETSEIVPASEPEPDPKTTPEYHFRVSFYRGCTGAWRADRRGKRKLENLLCYTG